MVFSFVSDKMYSKLFKFLMAVIIGIIVSNYLVPVFYKYLPGDHSRTKLILETLKQREKYRPQLLLFGNSTLMCGIDAKRLSEKLDDQLVFNLASAGQSVLESSLYYQHVPDSVHTVVQFMKASHLSVDNFPPLSKEVKVNFYMYGFRPEPVTGEILGKKQVAYFSTPSFMINFDARSVLPTSINIAMRQILRKDINLKKLETELFYPVTHPHKMSRKKYRMRIKQNEPVPPLRCFKTNKKMMAVLKKAARFFGQRRISYVVGILPINPGLQNITEGFKSEASLTLPTLNGENLKFMDFINLLPEEDFVDHTHPYRTGMVKLTNRLANLLKHKDYAVSFK